ncbi:MAG: AMP-binding protein [Spirochaetaceae bacterium]|nr:AMP-binding protein [Spirochaetaceae bacterium]
MAAPGLQVSRHELLAAGVGADRAALVVERANDLLAGGSPSSDRNAAEHCWSELSRSLLTPEVPFDAHRLLHERIFAGRDPAAGPAPVWLPAVAEVHASNLYKLMRARGCATYRELFDWSVANRMEFWRTMVERLGIRFRQPCAAIADLEDLRAPRWFPGARLNIAESCFGTPPDAPAIIHQAEGGALSTMTCAELRSVAGRVANGLVAAGYRAGDALAIYLPMTAEAVAIYLGIVFAGCTAVGIADSFAADEIRVRLRITGAKGIFTQDEMLRGGKALPLYAKVIEADAPAAIVLGCGGRPGAVSRDGDLSWEDFLSDKAAFQPVACEPDAPTNILFSSGTTGEPKAIPWTHATPVKCAADGWLHQDIRPGDVAAWPTSLGWMMGPWLIYASLVNGAAMALFDGAPTGREFGEFVQRAGVTMLGVVPSLVRAWRRSGCMAGLDWSAIRAFSSTGEPSNGEDYHFLMALAGYRPVIEYCGGTEIGGGYITGTVIQPAAPTVCTTPSLGLDFLILDDDGRRAANGEVFLRPPSIGLSTSLLNQDHHAVYFDGAPGADESVPLRRHGDQIEQLAGGGYRIHGRVDDTMNLGGIKVSSVEIERLLNTVPGVAETAAVAVQPEAGGPARLVIFAAPFAGQEFAEGELQRTLQDAIRRRLNPLFRIHEVVQVAALPRTASNKTMRRVLRAGYAAPGGTS